MFHDFASPPAGDHQGWIDIHSHLIPGVDDGCRDIEESLQCVRRLQQAGYIGSFCTPHIWAERFPQNLPLQIGIWTNQLRQALADHELDYQLWPGGEVRLIPDIVDCFKAQGVPTLANSRCVLVDFWEHKWSKWLPRTLGWLLEQGYQPILAHPERLHEAAAWRSRVGELRDMGVWLQGNFRSITGEEGFAASQMLRQYLAQGWYHFLALDMHVLDTLESRLDGLRVVEAEFGLETLNNLIAAAPRQWILGKRD